MKLILKSLRDKMISKSDKTEDAKICKNISLSQSDCIFAILIGEEQSLQEPSFSRSVTDMHQIAGLDLLRASIWEAFGQPKSIPIRSGGHPEGHSILDLDFQGCDRSGGRVVGTLEPGPW